MKRKAYIRIKGSLTWWDGWAEIIPDGLVKTSEREYGREDIYSVGDIEIKWAHAPNPPEENHG